MMSMKMVGFCVTVDGYEEGWFCFQAVEKYNMSDKNKVLEPYDIARAVMYAASVPEYVAVNEILVEPRDAPM